MDMLAGRKPNFGQYRIEKALLGSVGGARSVTVHSGRGNGWLGGGEEEQRNRKRKRGVVKSGSTQPHSIGSSPGCTSRL